MGFGVELGGCCSAEWPRRNANRAARRTLKIQILLGAACDSAACAAKGTAEVQTPQTKQYPEPSAGEAEARKNNEASGADVEQVRMLGRKDERPGDREKERKGKAANGLPCLRVHCDGCNQIRLVWLSLLGTRVATPNDPKLSDGGAWHGNCVVERSEGIRNTKKGGSE